MAIRIDSVRFENLSRVKVQHGGGNAIVILKLIELEIVARDLWLLGNRRRQHHGKAGEHEHLA